MAVSKLETGQIFKCLKGEEKGQKCKIVSVDGKNVTIKWEDGSKSKEEAKLFHTGSEFFKEVADDDADDKPAKKSKDDADEPAVPEAGDKYEDTRDDYICTVIDVDEDDGTVLLEYKDEDGKKSKYEEKISKLTSPKGPYKKVDGDEDEDEDEKPSKKADADDDDDDGDGDGDGKSEKGSEKETDEETDEDERPAKKGSGSSAEKTVDRLLEEAGFIKDEDTIKLIEDSFCATAGSMYGTDPEEYVRWLVAAGFGLKKHFRRKKSE